MEFIMTLMMMFLLFVSLIHVITREHARTTKEIWLRLHNFETRLKEYLNSKLEDDNG